MVEKPQYAALQKCTGAVVGSQKKSVWKVVAVDSVKVFARATMGRFLARTMDNLGRPAVVSSSDPGLEGKGSL